MQHIDYLELNLSNERARLAAATSAAEHELRSVWVAQLEREVAAERKLLGHHHSVAAFISDEDLLRELGA